MKHKGDFLYSAYVDKTGKIQYTFHNKDSNKTEKNSIRFRPTLGVISNTPTEYNNIHGDYIQQIEFKNLSEYRTFLKETPDAHGAINPIYQFISKYFNEQEVPEKIDAWFLDIEVYTQDNFPKADKALYEINAITLYSILEEKYYTLSTKPHKSNIKEKYKECIDEQHLLENMVKLFNLKNICLLVGFNSDRFDIPYILKRLKKYEFMSLTIREWIEENISYNGYLQGIQTLDYMDLYKMFGEDLEKYSLENVCQTELGEGKIKDSRKLCEIFDNDFEKFIAYNIHDVRLLVKLENKLELLHLALDMTSVSKVLPKDLSSSVRSWDGYLLNYLGDKNIMIPPEKTSKRGKLLGGFVTDEKDYRRGPAKNMMICDITSSYPHQIMQTNISPETLVDEKVVPLELKLIREKLGWKPRKIDDNTNVEKFLSKLVSYVTDFNNPLILELSICLKNYNMTMAANGRFYRKDKIGIFPTVVKELFLIRKKAKDNAEKLEEWENKINKIKGKY